MFRVHVVVAGDFQRLGIVALPCFLEAARVGLAVVAGGANADGVVAARSRAAFVFHMRSHAHAVVHLRIGDRQLGLAFGHEPRRGRQGDLAEDFLPAARVCRANALQHEAPTALRAAAAGAVEDNAGAVGRAHLDAVLGSPRQPQPPGTGCVWAGGFHIALAHDLPDAPAIARILPIDVGEIGRHGEAGFEAAPCAQVFANEELVLGTGVLRRGIDRHDQRQNVPELHRRGARMPSFSRRTGTHRRRTP